MISQDFTRDFSLINHTQSVLMETVEKLLEEQGEILETYYNKRTGNLARDLQSKPFNIKKSEAGVQLVINYMSQIRFMDLKKTKFGKKKQIYHQIYNRYVFGYLFGYAYNAFRSGILNYLRQETTAKVDAIKIEIPL